MANYETEDVENSRSEERRGKDSGGYSVREPVNTVAVPTSRGRTA